MRAAILSFGLIFLAACSADNNARELSRQTLVQVVSYEDAVRALSRTLGSSYEKTTSDLAKDSAYSGEVSVHTMRLVDAQEAAIEAMNNGGLTPPMLRSYVSETLKKEQDRQDAIVADIAALKAEQKKSMAALDVKETRFRSVRQKLEKLQADPGLTSYLNRLKPLFEAAKSAYKNSENTSNGEP
jgi:hypothetical protein